VSLALCLISPGVDVEYVCRAVDEAEAFNLGGDGIVGSRVSIPVGGGGDLYLEKQISLRRRNKVGDIVGRGGRTAVAILIRKLLRNL